MVYTKLDAHLNAARGYARLSHAKRLKVGAVLVKDDRIISIGYNGTVSGANNTCEYVVDGELVTKPGVVHAEMNVISFAAKAGVSTDGCSLVVTHSPCYECSKIIIQSGIERVYYKEKYRDETAINFLRESGITVIKIRSKNEEKTRTTKEKSR